MTFMNKENPDALMGEGYTVKRLNFAGRIFREFHKLAFIREINLSEN